MSTSLQNKLFSEIKSKSLFNKAQQFGYEYLNNVFNRNVFPTDNALNNLSVFNEPLPLKTTNGEVIIKQLNDFGSPATVAQFGGRYFGFVNGSAIPTGLAAKNLAMFWDQNTAMQVISPISSKLESVVENWLIDLFKIPQNSVAGFVSGTSAATFCGLAAARYRILRNLNYDINKKGLFQAPKIRIIAGKQAHSTVIKAIGLLGFGIDNIEWVDVDSQGRIMADKIPELDNSCILILQAGNVNSGSFDPFQKICKKAAEKGAWIHIDGAFGLWAAATQSLNHLTNGMELANSWSVDGHKTLNTPYDSGIILCNDKEALTSALHLSGSYIILGKDRDGMFYTPEMSRRSRIVELWATMKYLGKEGIEELISELHHLSVYFSEEIKKIDGFYVENEVVFNQVIIRCKSDNLTEKVLKAIQEERQIWVGGASWQNKKIIRVSICSWATTKEDIDIALKSFKLALKKSQ
ncbi:MAG: pyridoxal phosphate-dependent decarboxylase family protein [Lutibacter sp.]